jgi:ActR/RegA family two-component response regulator
MEVAIFENEYESVRIAFETANLIYFDDKINFVIFPSSQSSDAVNFAEFKVIFIDIDLSSKSQLDGYALIEKIVAIDANLKRRIIILTGNNKINESLISRGLNNLKILIKPTDYEEISKSILNIINNPQPL